MVLDVITISRRQPRLRSQKGAKIIFLSGVALYGCVFTLEGFVKNARFLSTTHLLPHGKFSWQQLLWKKMGGGKKKSNCSSIPREKKPVILSPTWCLTYFHKFARKYASRLLAYAREKASFLGHPWRNRGEKFPTSNASTTLFPSLTFSGEEKRGKI